MLFKYYNKSRFLLFFLAASIAIGVGLSGCMESEKNMPASTNQSISVTDSDGNVLAFITPPQRIVITGGNIAEVLVMIGAQDQIVGVGDSIKNDPMISGYIGHAESIGDYSVPSIEKIIALKPDLILCYSSDKPKCLDNLKKIGIQIGFFDCYKQNRLSEEVRKLGIITGKREKAEELGKFIDSVHGMIKQKVQNLPNSSRPKVYYETGTDYTAAATNSGGDWLITTAGGRNIAENTSVQWVKISPEWLILQNPDVIIKAGGDDNQSTLDTIWYSLTNRAGLSQVCAIQKNRTYILSHDILYGPRSVLGLIYIAKIIHPDQLADIDPHSYLDTFAAEFFPETNQSRVILPDIIGVS